MDKSYPLLYNEISLPLLSSIREENNEASARHLAITANVEDGAKDLTVKTLEDIFLTLALAA